MTDDTEIVRQDKYKVVTIEKIKQPEGLPGDNWYEYVIGSGGSKIVGKKPGTLKSVTAHAEAVADDLNERNQRGGSTYAPRQKKETNREKS